MSFQMSERDESGTHYITDRYKPCNRDFCTAFDCNGTRQGGCELFVVVVDLKGVTRGCKYQRQVKV